MNFLQPKQHQLPTTRNRGNEMDVLVWRGGLSRCFTESSLLSRPYFLPISNMLVTGQDWEEVTTFQMQSLKVPWLTYRNKRTSKSLTFKLLAKKDLGGNVIQ